MQINAKNVKKANMQLRMVKLNVTFAHLVNIQTHQNHLNVRIARQEDRYQMMQKALPHTTLQKIALCAKPGRTLLLRQVIHANRGQTVKKDPS